MEYSEYNIYNVSEEGRLNYTDPIVRHDPVLVSTTVARMDVSNDENSVLDEGTDRDSKTIDAIDIPVILMNHSVLDSYKIEHMSLNYDGFLPTLSLTVVEHNKELSVGDKPGMNNIITVVMTSRVNGAFKPISIDFYINSVQQNDNHIYYTASYRLPALEQTVSEEIDFQGCDGEQCQLSEDDKPTTYEFFHEIARKVGLGFATTEQVKEISDNKPRLIMNQNYKNALIQHLKFAGIDEMSVFDAWVDLYRYLVVVNVPWVLNENVSSEDIGMYFEHNSPMSSETNGDSQDLNVAQRILTNYREISSNINILIKNDYKWETNNNAIREFGTMNQFTIGGPVGYGDNNGSINQFDLGINDDTIDGMSENNICEFSNNRYLGDEMCDTSNGETPVLIQEQIRNAFFRKKRQGRLVVNLAIPNMGLQRGTLVYLMMFQYENQAKRQLLGQDLINDPDIQNQLINTNAPVFDYTMSGLWYIDGMEFTYSHYDEKINQRLYLIKKDTFNPIRHETKQSDNEV